MARAAQLGYEALALTDECSVAGVVRAHEEARRQREAGEAGQRLHLILASRFELQPDAQQPQGMRVVLLVHDRHGWGDLCELITRARLRGQAQQTVRGAAQRGHHHHRLGPRGAHDLHEPDDGRLIGDGEAA